MDNNAKNSINQVSPVSLQAAETDDHLTNWAGNLHYGTSNVHYPSTTEEVQEIVCNCKKLRALGSRHSFNRIADSDEHLVSLQSMNRILFLDRVGNNVTVEGGVRYGDLAPYLHENGYALANLASLPHITVVGACATATHGSGAKNGSLASSVSAIEFVNESGNVVSLSKEKDGEFFHGAVVHLGALGVVTKIQLDLVPTFEMKQAVYLDLPMDVLKNHFLDIQDQGYSVSLFTDWKNKTIGEVWIKTKTTTENVSRKKSDLYGAKLATEDVHPIAGQSAENVTEQRGVAGPWFERMPHFKMGFKPSAGEELQSEYFVPIERAYDAMMAIEKLNEKITQQLFISEIRTIAPDHFWLSPFYHRPSVAFHFTWKQDINAVLRLLPIIEEQLAPFDPRPHWGKLFTMSPKLLQSKYARLRDFRELAQQCDPNGKFSNDFTNEYVFQ